MKKKLMTLIAGICALALLGGCAGNVALSNDNIKIKKYKGLEVDKVEVIAVTDEDVELSIKSDLATLATKMEVTGRAAKLGDIATIDFTGKKDGVAFEGGSGTDYELELGSKTFIDGFEDGVVGHNIGETFDLDLKFPKTYQNEELAGKDVVFTVTLKGLQEKKIPELTVDVLAQLGIEAKSVEEYKARVKSDMEKSNKESAEYTLLNSVWAALVENCKVKKYPDGVVDEYVKALEEEYSSYAKLYSMDVDKYFELAFGVSIEEVAKTTATQELAMALIAEKEQLALTDEEYAAGIEKLAEQYGYEDTNKFLDANDEDAIRDLLLREKIGNFLIANSVQVEPKKNTKK